MFCVWKWTSWDPFDIKFLFGGTFFDNLMGRHICFKMLGWWRMFGAWEEEDEMSDMMENKSQIPLQQYWRKWKIQLTFEILKK